MGIEPTLDRLSSAPQTVLKTRGVVLNSEPALFGLNPTVH
jgi:hypothetical protein